MKKIMIKSLVCCSFAATIGLTSCNDIVTYGDDNYIAPENQPNLGAPEILGVYEVRDVIYDTPLDTIEPGQRVRISGRNLNHVQALSFNGVEVDVRQAACALDYCIAYVPEEFTIPQVSGLTYTTDMGTTTFPVAIRPLPLELSGLTNEFAPAGSEAAVAGRWFKAYGFGERDDATVTLNDTPLTVAAVTNQGMTVAIPADAPDNSIVTFRWIDAQGDVQEYACHYRPTDYRCFTELNLTTGDSFGDQEGYDLQAYIEEDGTDGIPSLGSPILRFQGRAKQWGWYSASIDSELHTPYAIAGQNDYDPSLTRGYAFEFEVMTLAPVPSSADADVNGITFSLEWGDRVEWCPSTQTEEFDTKGQWQTVRLPLSQVAQKGLRPASWGGTTHFCIILSPIVDGAEYNLRLSNFRIVRELNETIETDIPDNPDTPDTPDTPDDPDVSSIVLFQGAQVLGTEGNDAVTIDADKCASLAQGDYIAITITDLVDGWCQLNLAGTNPWTTHPDTNWSTFTEAGTLRFQITDATLLQSMQSGGIMIQGKNCTITCVEILRQ